MLVNTKYIFDKYKDKCILGFNVFGYEDASAIIRAAEDTGNPVILMTNRIAIEHMPIPVISGMLIPLAENSKTQVSVHLDHAEKRETLLHAINNGYTSVMFDGSRLSYAENVARTCEIVEYARGKNVSVEAEIGSIGYSDDSASCCDPSVSRYTDPEEAKRFYEATQVDSLAVAVGTLHRMTTQSAVLNFDLLKEIHDKVNVPLVIHGASGVKDEDLVRLAKNGVRKINIGTSIRMTFGNSIRSTIEKDPKIFDRIEMFKPAMEAVYREAVRKFRILDYQKEE